MHKHTHHKDQDFLIKYGLHNFVTSARTGERLVFFIRNAGGQTMIDHAKKLIEGSFGPTATVAVI